MKIHANKPSELKANDKKAKRNQLLSESDKFMLPDHPTARKNEWVQYRKALRDITKHPDWPDVALPVPPTEV